MKFNFSKRTVVITGGTRGIGLSVVKLFQNYDANIIATGTDKNQIKELNEKFEKTSTSYTHLDYNSDNSFKKFINKIKKYSNIDILINNAGINKIDSIQNISNSDWDQINNINLRGPFLLTREVSKIMCSNSYGKIVNISSIFGTISKKKRATYSTTKWGLIGFTKAVALDLATNNILVNAVSPGFIDTQLTRKILSKKELSQLRDTIPQNRLGHPDEIAKTILFLSSEHNSYITGQNIIIDGGFTCA